VIVAVASALMPVSLENAPEPPAVTAPSDGRVVPPPITAAVPTGARPAAPNRDPRPRPVARRPHAGAPVATPAPRASEGAFRATVRFLPEDVTSARQIEDYPPVRVFLTDAINVEPRRHEQGFPGVKGRTEWFGIDYRGRFEVRAAGYYTFRLVSDDGAILFIDDEVIIDNDGKHHARAMKMAMPLRPGEHELKLLYYQGPGIGLGLQLFVKGYRTPERVFGPEL
jgi:hypothetical protein